MGACGIRHVLAVRFVYLVVQKKIDDFETSVDDYNKSESEKTSCCTILLILSPLRTTYSTKPKVPTQSLPNAKTQCRNAAVP